MYFNLQERDCSSGNLETDGVEKLENENQVLRKEIAELKAHINEWKRKWI